MAPGPYAAPIQRLSQGVSKLSDGLPSNNMEGVRDLASAAIGSIAVTAQLLDQHLLSQGINPKAYGSMLSFPAIGQAFRNKYANMTADEITLEALGKGVTAGLRHLLKPQSAEEREREQEAKKKAEQAEAERKRSEHERDLALRERERREFLRTGERVVDDRNRDNHPLERQHRVKFV